MLYLNRPVARSFQLFPTTAFEIEEEISKLNYSKAVGPFSTPINLLKMLKTILSAPLFFGLLIFIWWCSGQIKIGACYLSL